MDIIWLFPILTHLITICLVTNYLKDRLDVHYLTRKDLFQYFYTFCLISPLQEEFFFRVILKKYMVISRRARYNKK